MLSSEEERSGQDVKTDEYHHAHHGHTEEQSNTHGTVEDSSGAASHAHHQHTDHPHADHQNHHAMMVRDFRRRFWISLAATIPVILLSPMLQEWFGFAGALDFSGDMWVLLSFSSFVYFYGGWPFLKGLVEEVRDGRPGMMTLVAMAISVAYVYSAAVVLGLSGKMFFWETVTLIDLMLLGHWIEMRSVLGASRALEELVKLMPSEAHLVREDGSTEDVPVTQLGAGDRVAVRPGEKVPADGRIVDGTTSMNESMLTGESRPVKKGEGDEVIAGAINGTGAVVFEVEKTGENSYLSQVVSLVREAQSSKSRTQDVADRAAFFLTVIAISVGIITFIIWFYVVDQSFSFSLERMVTVMVITCPHALGLAIPLVVAVSTSLSARNGLLIRNRSAFERARNLDTIVFDKTGTLTKGSFEVTDVLAFGDTSEDELLATAAAIESKSEHPVAQGVVKTARERSLALPDIQGFDSIPGKGVQGSVDGVDYRILSPGAVNAEGLSWPSEQTDELGHQGKTVVYIVRDNAVIGALALADVIRPESKEAVKRLHDMGIDVVMLTGDKKEVADWVASELELDRVVAEILPDQKSTKISELQKEERSVAMTGDGVNDAPALAQADVGIAIGAGTDVAVETADIVLVRSDPRDAVAIIELSKSTYSKMVQNLWYAAGYNIIAIPLAAGVLSSFGIILSPAVGAVLMSLSTVVVAINARMLKLK